MPYSTVVDKPLRIPDAFSMDNDIAAQSQAAFLLYAGILFKPTHILARYRKRPPDPESVPPEDLESLGIPPDVAKMGIEVSPENLLLTELINEIEKENALSPGTISGTLIGQPIYAKPISELQTKYTVQFFEIRDAQSLLRLLAVSLHHSDELVRVAAAISYLDAVDGFFIPHPTFQGDMERLVSILALGTASKELLIRDVAATALARILPEHPALVPLLQNTDYGGEGEPAHTSLIIHGTWARTASWWQPGGDFHTYILQSVDPSVYSGSDRFEWSGGYSDQARALAALTLTAWVQGKGLESPDFFAHSHGANVVLLANQAIDIGRMVLLACPVHPHKYWPNFGHVNRVVSVRVRLDLVILADRGGQRFNHPDIIENVLPVWFDHSAPHEPDIWIRYDVPTKI
ncbi:hypothetical protein C8R21_10297 [Nitrosospira multiformis]|jgi:hypothetical protein|uniref:Uncharacterized protein n=1 Tax=Nitrosospira multiformis TaxID=1231 RepID=A0A2T5IGY4_9PROT|nr:hypothetical protein [Nitrosospira multiformis]PTQ83094.1 hypothetical protein C8R21_10297 [Nitrosospira multiformis]